MTINEVDHVTSRRRQSWSAAEIRDHDLRIAYPQCASFSAATERSALSSTFQASLALILTVAPVLAASRIASVTRRFCNPSRAVTKGSALPRMTATKCSICAASGSVR